MFQNEIDNEWQQSPEILNLILRYESISNRPECQIII